MQFDSEFDKLLKKRLRAKAITTRYTTKADLVGYYQARQAHGEIKSWRTAIVADLAAITGLKEKNLQRRFDPSRLNAKVSPKNAKEYEALGKKLGVTRTPPPEGFKIVWNADLCISAKCGYVRGSTVTFSGAAAQALLDNPKIHLVIDAYFTDGGLSEVTDLQEINSDDSPVWGVKKMNFLKVNPKRKK